MHRYRFHDPRRFGGFDCFVDHFSGRLCKRDRNVSLREQVDGREFALRVVRVNEELFEALQLGIEIIEAKGDASVVLIGHDQAVTFGNVDFADLKTCLHEAARA